jgi:hypothetical protein
MEHEQTRENEQNAVAEIFHGQGLGWSGVVPARNFQAKHTIRPCCPVSGMLFGNYTNTFVQECNQPACQDQYNPDNGKEIAKGAVDMVF